MDQEWFSKLSPEDQALVLEDKEFYELPLEEQIKIFDKANNISKSAKQRHKEFEDICKKADIKLGDSVNFMIPLTKDNK